MSWRFLGAYACSGFAGLVYEVTWTRQFTLHLGHTTAAASTVVAAFLLGLALGAALVGRHVRAWSPEAARRRYAVLELGVAAAALLIPLVWAGATPVLRWAYGDGDGRVTFPLVRVAIAGGLVLMPALALGATYPLALRTLADGSSSPTRTSALLYATNTLGAAAGALLAGFHLIPALGVRGTTRVAAIVSTVSAVLALMTRPGPSADQVSASTTAGPATTRRAGPRRVAVVETASSEPAPERGRVALATMALGLSGFAALLHEIAWTRVLALTIGPTTYAFAAALAAVIAGTAAGAWLGTGLVTRVRQTALALAFALSSAAIVASLTFSLAGRALPAYVAEAVAAGAAAGDWITRGGWIATVLVVPTAIGLGAAFPLALAVARPARENVGARVGLIYAVNTVGAVGGSLAAGFWAIPVLGLYGTLQLACVCLIAASLLVVSRGALTARGQLAGLLAAAFSVVTLALSPPWDRALMAGGAYLYAPFIPAGLDPGAMLRAGSLRYYREGASATIAVKQLTGTTTLSVDGKTDASDRGDMLTQALVAHLPLLLHEAPREVAVVGLGSGVTVGAVLAHPVSRVDVIELSPEVVEASRHFDHANGRPLADPRTRLVVGDGRTHLRLGRQSYDVIVSEPSNPWIAGVAALFTHEYFTEARARLSPGGVFCQWANGYNIADRDLRAIAGTFISVFPNATAWLVGEHDVLFVGMRVSAAEATTPLPLDRLPRLWATRAGATTDLARYGATSPFAVLSLFVAGPHELADTYAAGAPRLDDDRMALEFSAPLEIHRQSGASNGATLRTLLDDGAAPDAIARARADATAVAWRERGRMFARSDAHRRAYDDFTRALTIDPDDGPALDGLVTTARLIDREADALGIVTAAPPSRPPSVERLVARSQLLAATGALDDARESARQAALAPDRIEGLAQVAQIAADVADGAALATALDDLRRAFPDHPRTSYFRGVLAMLDGDASAALAHAERAIARDASLAAVYDLAGAALTRLGRAGEARAMFERSLTFDAHDSTAYANLGLLALAAGQRDQAASRFAEALWLDPASSAARDGLGRALSGGTAHRSIW